MILDYKVSYLRTNEQRKRWEEEVILTKKEMSWTTEYFRYYEELWEVRAEKARVGEKWNSAGLMAYAQRQAGFWRELGRKAKKEFRRFEKED